MSIVAYMFVGTNIDPAEFVQAVRALEGVTAAHALFGPLDAIVMVEAPDKTALEAVVGNVHRTPGLKSGDTSLARSV